MAGRAMSLRGVDPTRQSVGEARGLVGMAVLGLRAFSSGVTPRAPPVFCSFSKAEVSIELARTGGCGCQCAREYGAGSSGSSAGGSSLASLLLFSSFWSWLLVW